MSRTIEQDVSILTRQPILNYALEGFIFSINFWEGSICAWLTWQITLTSTLVCGRQPQARTIATK